MSGDGESLMLAIGNFGNSANSGNLSSLAPFLRAARAPSCDKPLLHGRE
jgi:hypothetical protein